MKRFFITFTVGFFLTTSPLLACQCLAGGPDHSVNTHDQRQTCCHSDQAKKTAKHPNEQCCKQGFLPFATEANSYKVVFSKIIKNAIDKFSLQTAQPEPIKPEPSLTNIFTEYGNLYLSSIFQITHAPRAPPKV